MSALAQDTAAPAKSALPLVRPAWRRTRLWLALAGVVVLAAVVIAALGGSGGRPYDPASAHQDGSKALAVLLGRYGSPVHSGDRVSSAQRAGRGATIVVTAPDDYSSAQLRSLRSAAARLVLIAPGQQAAAAVVAGVSAERGAEPDGDPGCDDAGAQAAGTIDVPPGATVYRSAGSACYDGLLVTSGKVALLGSADLLRNDHLANRGVAALDVNVLSADRSASRVQWLLPGDDAAGSGPASVWTLFPGGWHRLFWWLIVVGALLALWRGRRLGKVVTEPLPVVVRSAEVVEGHGRLYERAGARARAAQALRAAALTRLTTRLRLPPGTDAATVAASVADVAPQWPRTTAQTFELLTGTPVADDAQLLALAQELDRLTDAVRAATTEGRPTT